MGNKTGYLDFSESGNWNVAADYTKLKIMKWLYFADVYEVIATFGTLEILDDFITNESMKEQARIRAIKRLVKTLQMIINNTIFAVRKDDRETLKKHQAELIHLNKVLPQLWSVTINQRDKKQNLRIDEERFNKILDMIIEIKSNINEPLNKADLIFTSVEELDPDELKRKIMEDMVNAG